MDTGILLAKLKGFGVTGLEHQWFWSYITGVSQSVSVDGHLSDPLPVNIGVPQGSTFGPLLFLLFLNDISTVTESCDINMLVDDMEIDTAAKPVCSSELESNVNIDLCKVKQYFYINRLSLNVQKCEFLLIGIHHSIVKMADVRIHINNEPLKHVLPNEFMFCDVMYFPPIQPKQLHFIQ